MSQDKPMPVLNLPVTPQQQLYKAEAQPLPLQEFPCHGKAPTEGISPEQTIPCPTKAIYNCASFDSKERGKS